MENYDEQGIENEINTPLEISSEENLQVLSTEDAAMINDCIKDVEIENGNKTFSKETLLPLEIEEVPSAMSDDSKHRTENLICDQHELLVKASSRTYNVLTEQHANEEKNVNDDKINQEIQAEEIVLSNIDTTQSNCNVYTERKKKNNIDILREDSKEQQNESIADIINNATSSEKRMKRANSHTSTTKKLTKRAKSSPSTISESKDENESVEDIINNAVSPKKEIKRACSSTSASKKLTNRAKTTKLQEAREKLGKRKNEARSNIRKQKKKKLSRFTRTKKLNLGRRGRQLKNQNNVGLHNDFKIPLSPQESDLTYYSSCIFCNENHDFHQNNKCSPKPYAAKIINEKKKSPWFTMSQCAIM